MLYSGIGSVVGWKQDEEPRISHYVGGRCPSAHIVLGWAVINFFLIPDLGRPGIVDGVRMTKTERSSF